jgi:ankyrin repeat protein
MWAVACNHESIAYFLLQSGAMLEATDNKARTSLMWAAINGQTTALKLLIESKANINAARNTFTQVCFRVLCTCVLACAFVRA